MVDAPVVVVRGEVAREVPPDLAVFAVTVAARDRDRTATLSRLAERSAALRTRLAGYGAAVHRQETGGVQVRPELRRSGERVSGYAASVTTTVTVTDFTVLGELMLRLADADQTSVSGPWWELRPEHPAYRAARRDAVTDAIGRAREYADAVGARLHRLLEISDESGGPGVPMRAMSYELSKADGPPQLELDPQVQTVHAAVRVRFTITEPADFG